MPDTPPQNPRLLSQFVFQSPRGSHEELSGHHLHFPWNVSRHKTDTSPGFAQSAHVINVGFGLTVCARCYLSFRIDVFLVHRLSRYERHTCMLVIVHLHAKLVWHPIKMLLKRRHPLRLCLFVGILHLAHLLATCCFCLAIKRLPATSLHVGVYLGYDTVSPQGRLSLVWLLIVFDQVPLGSRGFPRTPPALHALT